MNPCLVCQNYYRQPAERVTAWTTNPITVWLCPTCQRRWSAMYGITIRASGNLQAGSGVPSPAGPGPEAAALH